MIEVTTKRLAVCWDTGAGGIGADGTPLPGVPVGVSGPGDPQTDQTTQEGSGCKVTFGPVPAGEWRVEARVFEGYEWASADRRVAVEPGGTAQVSLRLKRNGLECNRQHPAPAGGTNDGPSIWLPVLWVFWSEPWALLLRDGLWLTAAVFVVLGAGAWDLMPDSALCAFSAAATAYLTLMIFGQVLGLIMIIAAAVLWVVVIAIAVSASVASFLPLPPSNPLWLGVLNGGWTAFLAAALVGRTPTYSIKGLEIPFAMALVGALIALITFFVATSGEPPWTLLVFGGLFAAFWAFVFGWIGHIFVNEGRTVAEHWSPQEYRLPYAGQRYCVQGVRGIISHYDWQEYANDFAVPEGKPVLCAREGHIIKYKEDRTGTAVMSGNSKANYVHVRHRDGSVAEYLHGKQGGVTSLNPKLASASSLVGAVGDAGAYMNVDNVYVAAGHSLCEAGNVGISMFSHIHFVVKRGPADPANLGEARDDHPVLFMDPDVQGHGGRCFSLRKYESSNQNLGPVEVPAPVTP